MVLEHGVLVVFCVHKFYSFLKLSLYHDICSFFTFVCKRTCIDEYISEISFKWMSSYVQVQSVTSVCFMDELMMFAKLTRLDTCIICIYTIMKPFFSGLNVIDGAQKKYIHCKYFKLSRKLYLVNLSCNF